MKSRDSFGRRALQALLGLCAYGSTLACEDDAPSMCSGKSCELDASQVTLPNRPEAGTEKDASIVDSDAGRGVVDGLLQVAVVLPPLVNATVALTPLGAKAALANTTTTGRDTQKPGRVLFPVSELGDVEALELYELAVAGGETLLGQANAHPLRLVTTGETFKTGGSHVSIVTELVYLATLPALELPNEVDEVRAAQDQATQLFIGRDITADGEITYDDALAYDPEQHGDALLVASDALTVTLVVDGKETTLADALASGDTDAIAAALAALVDDFDASTDVGDAGQNTTSEVTSRSTTEASPSTVVTTTSTTTQGNIGPMFPDDSDGTSTMTSSAVATSSIGTTSSTVTQSSATSTASSASVTTTSVFPPTTDAGTQPGDAGTLLSDASSNDASQVTTESQTTTQTTSLGEGGLAELIEATLGLPPAPGPDGDLTVFGADANQNLVRDDVEREIAFLHWPDTALIAQLTRLARLDQLMLTNVGSADVVADAFYQKKLVLGCLGRYLDGDFDALLGLLGEVMMLQRNTQARFEAGRLVELLLGGQLTSLPTAIPQDEQCAEDPQVDPEQGEGEVACLNQAATVVTYFNDAFTQHDKAVVELMALRQRISGFLTSTEAYKFRLAFADSERFWTAETTAGTLGDLAARNATQLTETVAWLSGGAGVPGALRPVLERIASERVEADLVEQEYGQSLLIGLTSEVTVGNRVLAVAHGLGAAYAELSVAGLGDTGERDFIRVLGFGSSHVELDALVPGSQTTNLADDWMLHNVYNVLTGVDAPGNVENSNKGADADQHQFIAAYIDGDAAGPELDVGIVEAIVEVAYPEALGTDGIITVTLTWGEAPDVDLHALEPNGFHVYYGTPDGLSGSLDVDDTAQYGPEHYTVGCDTLELGLYGVAVNYYDGPLVGEGEPPIPETALVNIVAGTQTRTYEVFLPEPLGEYGDSEPLWVAAIEVAEGSTPGTFTFAIQSLLETPAPE